MPWLLGRSGSPVSQGRRYRRGDQLSQRQEYLSLASLRHAWLAIVNVLAMPAVYHNRQESMVTLRHIKRRPVQHRDKDERQLLGD